MEQEIFIDTKPYTYKYRPGFWWYNGFYEIIFQDTVISFASSKKEVNNILGLLNGAYISGATETISQIKDCKFTLSV